jgi:hypothetical protein
VTPVVCRVGPPPLNFFELVQRALRGSTGIPDMEYAGPKEGRKKIVEFSVMNWSEPHEAPSLAPPGSRGGNWS